MGRQPTPAVALETKNQARYPSLLPPLVAWVRASQWTTSPAPTPAKGLTHSGPFPLSAVTSARLPQVTFAPRIICGQGQDTRAHSSWPSPGPPGTTNKVTGSQGGVRRRCAR